MTGHDPRRLGRPPASGPPMTGMPPTASESIAANVGAAVAAERDRIRQLAEQHGAEYPGPPHPCRCHDGACQLTVRDRIPFATLLDAPAVPAIPTEGTTS